MTDDRTDVQNRRQFLQLGGGALLAGLAGCARLGGGATEDPMADTETSDSEMDGGMTDSEMDESTPRRVRVRIENVSTGSTLRTMDGGAAVPLSPGAFVVHTDPGVLFEVGEAASDGLERLAEDGTPGALVETLGDVEMGATAGAFDTPVGAGSAGPLTPGDAYEFEVEAGSDARLSFATMFVQSNDLFYAPDPAGIALFEAGEPVDGSVTDQVALWDAGTEVNEEPGSGPNQAPRQPGPDTGAVENDIVRRIAEIDDGFTYPAVADVISVTVTPTN